MRIEVDLLQIHDAPDLGRVAAVAILSALPQDEAEMAIDEWRAVLGVRAGDDLAAMAADVPFEAAGPDSAERMKAETEWSEGLKARFPLKGASDPQQPQPGEMLGGAMPDVSRGTSSEPAATRLEDVLSAKVAGALKRAGFQVLGDLECRSAEWLLGTVDGFGKVGIAEVESVMRSVGLSLSDKPGVPQRVGPPRPRVEMVDSKTGEEIREIKPGVRYNVKTRTVLDDATLPFEDEPQKPRPEEPKPANGADDLAGLSLRQLCLHVGDKVGRDKVFDAIGRRKLAEIPAAEEAGVRAALESLLMLA